MFTKFLSFTHVSEDVHPPHRSHCSVPDMAGVGSAAGVRTLRDWTAQTSCPPWKPSSGDLGSPP